MKTNAKRTMSKRSRVILFLILGVAAAGLVFGAKFFITFVNYKKDVAAIQVQNVDLSTVEDGEYLGSCDVGFVRADVRVVVQNHIITELELLRHDNGRGAPAEVLPGRMIEAQRIDVDAVSGATSSSKVIQKAVYNALTGQRTSR